MAELTEEERKLWLRKSRVIRIRNRTFERLQEHAEPLKDKPDTVINRLLDILEIAVARITFLEQTEQKGA